MAYAAYVALFVLLPGIVVVTLTATRPQQPVMVAAKALVIGQCIEMCISLVATMLAARWLYIALPLVYLGGLVAVRHRILEAVEATPKASFISVVLSAAVGIALVFAAALYNFDPVVDQHFTWMAAFGNTAVTHWPPSEPFLMDVPLHYHYLFNVHVGSAAETFHIPLILVASRLAIVFHALVFVLTLYAFCAARFRAGWLGAVAAVQLLLTFGYSAVMWEQVHLATASIMFRVASTMVAFQLFLVLCDEILGLAKNERLRTYLLLGFLLLVASGTRAMLLPVLCGGIGLLFLFHLRDRIARRIYATVLGMALVSVALGAVFFLGLGSGDSDGTSLLRLSPLNLAVSSIAADRYSPFVDWLLAAGLPAALASLAYLVVAIAGRTTFLLPGVLYGAFSRGSGIDRNVRVMLGGVAIAGITLLVFVETVIPQEIWAFYWYADIALALLGPPASTRSGSAGRPCPHFGGPRSSPRWPFCSPSRHGTSRAGSLQNWRPHNCRSRHPYSDRTRASVISSQHSKPRCGRATWWSPAAITASSTNASSRRRSPVSSSMRRGQF